jgi:uncharacterized protein involved in exopolysaccharide biosynthesis
MQLRLNGENQIRALDRRERLEQQRIGVAATGPPQAASPESERLSKLTQQLDDLRGRFTDAYPDVVRLRAEIDTLSGQIARHPRPEERASGSSAPPGQSASILEVDSELRSLRKDERLLRQAIAGYEQRVDNAPRRQQQLQELSRDDDTAKERYETLLKRYEEAQLASSLAQGRKVEQFRILDAAIPPREPSAPSRVRVFAIGFTLALALGVAAVLLTEKLDTAFHSIEDLRAHVTVPALFNIPRIITTKDARRRWRRGVLTAVCVGIGLALVISGSRYVAKDNERLVQLTSGTRG